jgi:hypothetical protein
VINNTEEKQAQCDEVCKDKCKKANKSMGGGAFYGLGFVGAAVYFIMHSHTFLDGVIGILKAIVWPALVSFKLLEFFKF